MEFEETIVKNNEPHTYLAIKFPLFSASGNVNAIGAIATDITERKDSERGLEAQVKHRTIELQNAYDELRYALRMKDDFLNTISHELRTPLNVIMGNTENLQEEVYGSLNPSQETSLEIIQRNSRNLLSMIDDILDLSKSDSGNLNLQLRSLPIESVCRKSLEKIAPEVKKKKLTLSTSFETPSLMIDGDDRFLSQILDNLLNNAVKFCPEQGKISLEMKGDITENEFHVIVSDTGIGIAKKYHTEIFQPFIRLDSGLSRKFSGSGLGLSLVDRLTRIHGGRITLESEPGKGSRFTVSLPIRQL